MNITQLLHKVTRVLRQKPIDALLFIIFSLAIIQLLNLYAVANIDDAEWEQFKQANECMPLIADKSQRLGWQ